MKSDKENSWIPVPFRVRDLTFPIVLVMGFMPRPAESLSAGAWAIEANYSVSNNFQVSDDVQAYLEERDGPRRPLSQSDIDSMLGNLEGDQFYFDSEFNLFDLGIHYGLTDRMTVSLHLSYLHFQGGFLDSTIYNFHDIIDIGQAGRNYVTDDRFQMFYMGDDEPFVLLDRPSSGGFTDPIFSLSYTFPQQWNQWKFGIEGGFKIPIADEDILLSTGSVDFGLQLTAQKTWQKNALVMNLAYVVPGDFEQSENFEPPNLPSVNTTYLHRFGQRTTGIAQFFFSENIFRDETDSKLSELEFQFTIGVKIEALNGSLGFALTENLFNFDNTPDFGVHLSYAILLD